MILAFSQTPTLMESARNSWIRVLITDYNSEKVGYDSMPKE